jgi:hypothetical protein
MRLHLTSAYKQHACLDRALELQRKDANQRHQLTSDPAMADAIVFIENTQFDDILFKRLTSHPLVLRYPEKVYMYNEMDRAWPVLPGLYCSLTARLASYSDHVAFPYLDVSNTGIETIFHSDTEQKWLFSFVGSRSHALRKKIFKLQTPNSCIIDTSEFCTWDPKQTSKFSYQKLYTDTIAQSKFVLCPRGIGPASLRLYETIEAGRVPVIISDSWVPPPQIDWRFAVRIPEWDIASIPSQLAALENEWQDRSVAARLAWESAYSPDHMFDTFATAIENISKSAFLPQRSLTITAHKLLVAAELQLRNRTKASLAGEHSPMSDAVSLLGRLFSRKV